MAVAAVGQEYGVAARWRVWRRRDVREAGLLAILPVFVSCVMLWPALLGRGVLASTDLVAHESIFGEIPPGVPPPISANPMLNDPVDQFIPWRLYARSELRAGRFPLWNPYNGLGTHFHANYQSAVLSPFNILWLALPPIWGLGAIIALKWAVMGLGLALLLRRLGLSMPAAMFGSVAGQLMGPMVGWLQWPHTEALAWLPWMMLAALAWIDTRNPLWLVALSAIAGAELLAGHVETAFYSFVLMGAFDLAALGASLLPIKAKLSILGGLIGAGVLGAGIAASQFLPLFGILTSSWQWVERGNQDINTIPAPPLAALTLLSPNGFGWADAYHGPSNWLEACGYVGALTLLLAGWGVGTWLLSLRREKGSSTSMGNRALMSLSPRKPLFWLLVVAVAASMTYGIPPLSLLRSLPGFNSSLNYRLISLVDVALVILGAMGLQWLLEWRGALTSKLWLAVLALLGAGGLLFLANGWRIWTVNSQDVAAYIRAWQMWAVALFCAGALLILLRLTGLLQPRSLAVLATGLLLLDMMRAGWNFNVTSSLDTFYPGNELTDFLALRGRTERVAIDGPYGETNRLMPYRVPDYRYYDPTEDNRYITFTHIMSPGTYTSPIPDYSIHAILDEPSATLMSLVGIKWLVTTANLNPNTWQPVPARGGIYRPWMNHNSFVVWENRYTKPYAYLASRIKLVTDEGTARQSMKDLTLEGINEVTVETGQRESFPQDVASASNNQPLTKSETESVQVQANIPGTIKIEVNTEKPRFLVVNEAWSSGWQATVDGHPTTLYRASYIAQGLAVPQGLHDVVLNYDPPVFKVGLAISGLSLLGWIGLLIFALHRTRKGGSEATARSL